MTYSEEIKQHLNVLGLDSETNIDEAKLKKAYLKASKKYHPDVCEAQYKDGVMFKKVNEANTFIKDNMEVVNDYLSNPSKYEYQRTNNYSSNQANQQYTYTYMNADDLFRQFFRSYNNTYQKEYTEEELKEMKKERTRRVLKRKIASACSLAFGILISFVSPFIGLIFIVLSLSQLLF
jgi:DnaJ-class molecular chaperone